MENTLVVTERKYSKSTRGYYPHPTALQFAFYNAIWSVPDKRFKGLWVNHSNPVTHAVVDGVSRIR